MDNQNNKKYEEQIQIIKDQEETIDRLVNTINKLENMLDIMAKLP